MVDAIDWLGRSFQQPWWLVLLLLAPLLPRRRDALAQALALVFLAIALAGPRVAGDAAPPAILVDVSDSARAAALDAGRTVLRLSDLPAVDAWLFAGEASQVPNLDANVIPEIDPGRSDLVRAVTQARSSGANRILVVSDGIDTRHVDPVAMLAQSVDVTIDVLPIGPSANLRVDRLDVPSRVGPGEPFTLSASIRSRGVERVAVTLTRDGKEVERTLVDAPDGETSVQWTVRAPDVGGETFMVTVSNPDVEADADDALSTRVSVEARRSIIVVGDDAMARLLRDAGMQVEVRSPATLTISIDAPAVIIRGSVVEYSLPQLEAMRRYVEAGGGLLMTGGEASFGLGGWFRTPVEEVLPVQTDLRSDVDVPLVAMMMVIDTSRSMETGAPSKLALAQRGVGEVIDLAFERDLLGLIAFNDDRRVVFPLRAATSRGKREMLQATQSLEASGGTVLEPALRDALDALEASDAAIKHAIVLSDGRLYEGASQSAPLETLRSLASEAREGGVTLTAIAVGDQADAETLASLAEAGGGRFYEALDVATLPRIFASEAVTATRSLLRENPGAPTVQEHPLLAGVPAPPGPSAYVATRVKEGAEVLWAYPREESLLSLYRFGLGRTAAFTSDVSQWLGDLATWEPLAEVLVTTVRWLAARPDRFAATVTADPLEASGGRLEVTAVEEGGFLDGLNLSALGGGRSVMLESVGPGRYAADLPPEMAGVPLVVVEGDEVVSRARFVTQDPEFREVDGEAMLARLAAVTGGRVLDPGLGWLPPAGSNASTLRAPFALAALVMALVAWALRRFAPPSRVGP